MVHDTRVDDSPVRDEPEDLLPAWADLMRASATVGRRCLHGGILGGDTPHRGRQTLVSNPGGCLHSTGLPMLAG